MINPIGKMAKPEKVHITLVNLKQKLDMVFQNTYLTIQHLRCNRSLTKLTTSRWKNMNIRCNIHLEPVQWTSKQWDVVWPLFQHPLKTPCNVSVLPKWKLHWHPGRYLAVTCMFYLGIPATLKYVIAIINRPFQLFC